VDDSGAADAWKGGLAGDDRFDVAFWLTLLRADVFGAAQASIVGKLRKRAVGVAAIEQTIGQVDDTAYATAARFYADVREQLRLESLAALAMLMEAGAVEAILLLEALGGTHMVRQVIGPRAGGLMAGADEVCQERLREQIAPLLKGALANPSSVAEGAARAVIQEAIAATRKVNRIGFRREHRSDSEILAALKDGASAISAIVGELDRLTAILLPKVTAADLKGDRERFAATFRRLYLVQPSG
jgi:hypothetical protein